MRRERREREGEIQEREREGVRTGESEGENRKERERFRRRGLLPPLLLAHAQGASAPWPEQPPAAGEAPAAR